MRIRMLHDRTGGRYDGQAWPARGGEFDVPDEEGAELVARGVADETRPAAPRKPRTAKPADQGGADVT